MLKKLNKRIFSLMLCVLMALSLCACSGDGDEKGTEAGKENTVKTTITTDSDSYTVDAGKSVYIEASCDAEDSNVYISYESADKAIATVSTLGKITGVAGGTTEIIVKTSDGASKTVSVTVNEVELLSGIRLALNVMYNDMDAACYENFYGGFITVEENGQYTVSIDFDEHVADAVSSYGIKGFDNLTSVYIKDFGVTNGDLTASNLVSCDIVYDKVVVDGVELTITKTEPKTAIKSSGIFDTNDPLNAWDGGSVLEVVVDETNHVLNIDGMKNPKTIEVTFTLSNLVFKD